MSLVHRILRATHGRSTAFFALFFIAGTALAWFNKLTGEYVAFMGTLGGLVLGHSIKEDVVQLKRGAPAAPDTDHAS